MGRIDLTKFQIKSGATSAAKYYTLLYNIFHDIAFTLMRY